MTVTPEQLSAVGAAQVEEQLTQEQLTQDSKCSSDCELAGQSSLDILEHDQLKNPCLQTNTDTTELLIKF